MIFTAWVTHRNKQHTDDVGCSVHTKPLICQLMINILNFHLKREKDCPALDPAECDGEEEEEHYTPSSSVPDLCPYCRTVLFITCIQEALTTDIRWEKTLRFIIQITLNYVHYRSVEKWTFPKQSSMIHLQSRASSL